MFYLEQIPTSWTSAALLDRRNSGVFASSGRAGRNPYSMLK